MGKKEDDRVERWVELACVIVGPEPLPIIISSRPS